MEDNEIKRKETFLEKIQDEKTKAIIGARVEQLKNRETDKKRSKELSQIMKETLECDVVDVGGESLTIGDMLAITAIRNSIDNPRTTFKDLNDAQKVVDNATEQNTGMQVVVITNGQDLGDEI